MAFSPRQDPPEALRGGWKGGSGSGPWNPKQEMQDLSSDEDM